MASQTRTLLVVAGDNPDRLKSEGAFAHLCGTAPIPASSGKVVRHRLNPNGNREANRALYVVALNRMDLRCFWCSRSHQVPLRTR